MKVYHLYQKQFLPLTLEEAWHFFSHPENLLKITPPDRKFKMLYRSGDTSGMYAGQIMTYSLKVFPFVYVLWVTEITHYKPMEYFVDDQIKGPYAMWHHQHRFKAVAGGVEMTDEINYAVPFGFIGRIANSLFIAKQLSDVFKFRHNALEKMFLENELIKTRTA
jgi:ligand-binding SRPBCC domain-containing protein